MAEWKLLHDIIGPPGTFDLITVTMIPEGGTASGTVTTDSEGRRVGNFRIPRVPGGLTAEQQVIFDQYGTDLAQLEGIVADLPLDTIAMTGAVFEFNDTLAGDGFKHGVRRVVLMPKPGPVVADVPQFSQANLNFTVPRTLGVRYFRNNVEVSGTMPVTPPATVTIEARPLPGYSLEGVTSWTYAFSDPTALLKPKILSMNPTYFLPLDDPAGTVIPKHYGTLNVPPTVTGSGSFGHAEIGGGTSWTGPGFVLGPNDIIDGDTVCSGFFAFRVMPAATGADGSVSYNHFPTGNDTKWRVQVTSASGGTAARLGVTFSDTVSAGTNPGFVLLPGKVNTFGFSIDASGTRVYLNGQLDRTLAATAMKSASSPTRMAGWAQNNGTAGTSGGSMAGSALWSGVALTAAQHATLATAAGAGT